MSVSHSGSKSDRQSIPSRGTKTLRTRLDGGPSGTIGLYESVEVDEAGKQVGVPLYTIEGPAGGTIPLQATNRDVALRIFDQLELILKPSTGEPISSMTDGLGGRIEARRERKAAASIDDVAARPGDSGGGGPP